MWWLKCGPRPGGGAVSDSPGGGEGGSGPARRSLRKGPRSAPPPGLREGTRAFLRNELQREPRGGRGWRGQTQAPLPRGWHSFLETLQDVCVAPCCGPGFHGIPEMPGRAGTLGQMAAAPIAPNYVQLNGWAPPTSSESQECCHLATHSLISLAFLRIAGTRGVGVLRTPGDAGNASLPPQIAGSQSWTDLQLPPH